MSNSRTATADEGYVFKAFCVPAHLVRALHDYAAYGYLPGRFLQAVISNDLAEACGRADDEAARNLPALVAYLVHEAPPACWGSAEKMRAWVAHMAEVRSSMTVVR
jgi:hypothetical protein